MEDMRFSGDALLLPIDGMLHPAIELWQEPFAIIAQKNTTFYWFKKRSFNFLLQNLFHVQAVDPGAEGFDEIERQRRAVVLVGMQDAQVRIEPSGKQRLFNHGVQHAVEVIDHGVEELFYKVCYLGYEAFVVI